MMEMVDDVNKNEFGHYKKIVAIKMMIGTKTTKECHRKNGSQKRGFSP